MSNGPTQRPLSGAAAAIAHRYAGALFALADESGQLDAVSAELRVLNRGLCADPAWPHLAHNPCLSRARVDGAIQAIIAKVQISHLIGNFLRLLAQHARLNHLSAIIAAYEAQLAKHQNIADIAVTTATPLSSAQRERLEAQLARIAGCVVRLTVHEDATLLGGMVVSMGSRRVDASVKGKLMRLERHLRDAREVA